MAVTNRHTDAGLSYNGENIKCLSGNGIFRMIDWIPSPRITSHPALHEANQIETTLVTITGDTPPNKPWTITNPLTGNCVYGVAMNTYDNTFVNWSVLGFQVNSPGINNMLTFGGENQCFNSGACFWVSALPAALAADVMGNSGTGCSNSASHLTSDAQHYWHLFQLAQFGNLDLHGDISFTDDFVAIARNWEIALIPPRPPRYPSGWAWPPSWMPIPTINDSWERVRNHSMSNSFYAPHTPLIFRLDKYGTGCGTDFNPKDYSWMHSYTDLLDGAPDCGPHNYWGDYGHDYGRDWEWSGTNRLLEPTRRDHIAGSNFPGNGVYEEYNGLDYMFLFQLYALTETSNYIKGMINPYYAEGFAGEYPDPDNLGSHSLKLQLNYLEYLSAKNKVKQNGDLTFRGAKVIDLLPGFETEKGAAFMAYIKDYSCGDSKSPDGTFHYALMTQDGKDIPIEYNPDKNEHKGLSLYNPVHNPDDYLADSLITPEVEYAYIQYLLQRIDSSESVNKSSYQQLIGNVKPAGDYMILSPNPSSGIFKILLSNAGDYKIEVVDLLGRNLYTKEILDNDKLSIDLSSLASGNYTITATSAAKKYTKQLAIAK